MKGGKRLSEEARKRIVDGLRYISFVIAWRNPIKAAELDAIADEIERDDEPEYCTWKENPVFKGLFHPSCVKENSAHYPEPADMAFCPYCGKPVKEE